MVIERYDPFRNAISLRTMMDRLFDESVLPFGRFSTDGTLALDVTETKDAYTVKASLPGVKPEDVAITAEGNTLTITGETKAEEDKKEKDYVIRERREGRYARTFTLPTPVNTDKVEATFADGVLTLTVPKAEVAKPKQIKVKNTVPLFRS